MSDLRSFIMDSKADFKLEEAFTEKPKEPTPDFNDCQKKAWHHLTETEANIFLTGAAGTGKSFMINQFLRGKSRITHPVISSTGASAILLRGRTFHSFFGLGLAQGTDESIFNKAVTSKAVCNNLKDAECIILDEVSMITGRLLFLAEGICCKVRGNNQPWGGIRIVVVGDFFQLPPVRFDNKIPYDWAFNSTAWSKSFFQPVNLKTVVRTKNIDFVKVLNHIRIGQAHHESVQSLVSSRTLPWNSTVNLDGIPRLYSVKKKVEEHNYIKLKELEGEYFDFPTVYRATSEYQHEKPEYLDRFFKQLRKNAPISQSLELKIGALVMARTNNLQMGYANGSVGTVLEVYEDDENAENDYILVDFKDCGESMVKRFAFQAMNASGNPVAEAFNFPLNLAWAVTIHKAQGCSMDAVAVDLSRIWDPGQAYVALSRARTLENLHILAISPNAIFASPDIVKFYESLDNE